MSKALSNNSINKEQDMKKTYISPLTEATNIVAAAPLLVASALDANESTINTDMEENQFGREERGPWDTEW